MRLFTLALHMGLAGVLLAAGIQAADEFVPVALAESLAAKQAAETVAQPEAVKETKGFDDKKTVEAATAQDAINAAVKNIPATGGCEQIRFPSGFGWVSTGVAVYNFSANPLVTLRGQQLACQKAFIHAKKAMAETLFGLSTTAQEKMVAEIKTLINDTDALANSQDKSAETITETVKGMLRGFVIYKIDDKHEGQTGTISLTIVATPKTMGQFSRPDLYSLTADSVQAGLNHVMVELGNSLLPPVGGKMIFVPQTKEMAFVGFGNSLVARNENPAMQKKLELNAQKVAILRARSALCGFIVGDDIAATTTLDDQTKEITQQFAEIEAQDPIKDKDEKVYQKLAAQKTEFLNTQLSKETITSVRKGILPPGVRVKAFFNPERTIVRAVAVYIPSVANAANDAGQQMKNSQLLQPVGGNNPAPVKVEGQAPATVPPSTITIPTLNGQVCDDNDL